MSFLRYSSFLLLLPLAACGEGPEKISAPPQPAGSGHAPMGAASGQMPNDSTHTGMQSPHGTQDLSGEAKLIASGTVELGGDFAGVAEGWLFVMTRDAETGGPGYVSKVAVADGAMNAAGHQVVPFRVSTGDFAMGAMVGDDFLLEVRYDHDGMVDSKDGNGTVTIPATSGQQDVTVLLDKVD
ncbi:MAG: hypothetical protein H6831_01965 [Planctomycetes bacterium]|nr:hypothetical protein [Planctomycetota bacterium]MCB9903152.1 hypothetical protein [Planctomycetota bacterium]